MDTSFAGRIGGHWNAVGRWVYSLADRTTIEQNCRIDTKAAFIGSKSCSDRYLRGFQRRPLRDWIPRLHYNWN